MADLMRDETGQTGTMSRPETGQDGTTLFRGVPIRPGVSLKKGKVKASAPTVIDTQDNRRLAIGGTKCWIEAARRLHAAGFSDAAIAMALEAGVERDAKQVTA